MKAVATLAPALRDAARMVARVAAGRSLAEEFGHAAEEGVETPRAALLDLTHGTLRRHGRVQFIVRELSRRGQPEPLVEALLWCSLYALESARYADYTVVDQAVRACALLERWTAKGYVNGLLRSYLRERASLQRRISTSAEANYQHPQWWIDLVRSAYPGRWEDVMAAGNSHPPMTLRVNTQRVSVEQYAARLAAAGMQARSLGDAALRLERAVPAERLPGFAQGEVSVQDFGAQRAARCLELAPGQRVLDACAAPGGKSAHILESADVSLTALEADASRRARIERNLERLGLAATIRTADCTQLDAWWDGTPFDRVLADVPCSASGVARRHPDVKWLRRATDLPAFAARQAAILDALWQALAAGGKLLYVTCSLFPQENEELVEAFVARAQGARRVPLTDGAPPQWLPGEDHDGFFYALIQKQA
ncbi:MAG: 16S rRNA (cytosine(967)-C(5))-methyltransferase RsmB [Betaproteobacteria bacterium]|nr:MAG: 16S rRNA (cytosine(967)-C(5))-methyltransferase RsmB [Betaproteobacteria bacterium]